MALSKIQTGLVDTNAVGATELNLADNFAFTGTVSGAGKIGQIVQSKKTDHFTTTSTSYIEIPGWSLVITPAAASSKIRVECSIHHASVNSSGGGLILYRQIGSGSFASVGQQSTQSNNRRKSNFAGSAYTGDGASDEIMVMTAVCDILDVPNTTQQITYKVYCVTQGSSYFFNRPETTGNTGDQVDGVGTLTATEILA